MHNKACPTEVFKTYGVNPISYTASIEDKIKAINDDLVKKIDEYYSKILNFDFSKIKQALNKSVSEPTDENLKDVMKEINLINYDQIRDNIYNIFYRVFSL